MKTLYPFVSATASFRTVLRAAFFSAIATLICTTGALAGGKNTLSFGGGGPVVPDAILPTTLINWSLSCNTTGIQLQWTTTIEKNISHFIIEKSFDGVYYKDDAMIVANGNSSIPTDYRYTDKIPVSGSGIIYYRLRLVTVNGRTTVSEVRIARLDNTNKLQICAYPNPVVNELRVAIPQPWQNKPVNLRLVNATGQVITAHPVHQAGPTEIISMSALPAGVYHLSVSNGTATSTQTIVKAGN